MVKVFLVVGVVVNIAIAFLLLYYFLKSISIRLNTVTDNSFRLARGQRLNPPLAGADEIAQLDDAFRSMAEALAEATAAKSVPLSKTQLTLSARLTWTVSLWLSTPPLMRAGAIIQTSLWVVALSKLFCQKTCLTQSRSVRSVRGATGKVSLKTESKA